MRALSIVREDTYVDRSFPPDGVLTLPVPDIVVNSDSSDGALVAAMARGDERAAGELYNRHSHAVMAVAFRLLGERVDAEGIVLETFTQAWRDAARFDAARASVLTWLRTIARTRAIDHLRSAGRQARLVPSSIDDLPPDSVPAAQGTDPALAAERDEQQRAVAAALRTLPENQRTAIELSFFEGLSHSEIAVRLSEPLGTVKTRVRLAMNKLRDVLRPYAEAVS